MSERQKARLLRIVKHLLREASGAFPDLDRTRACLDAAGLIFEIRDSAAQVAPKVRMR
jgi:hypothetical protein